MTTLILPARLESLACGLALVVQCANAAGFPSKRVTEIELAVEEGMQDLDYAATITLLEKWAGIAPKAAPGA